jgi:hypothetical protein
MELQTVQSTLTPIVQFILSIKQKHIAKQNKKQKSLYVLNKKVLLSVASYFEIVFCFIIY